MGDGVCSRRRALHPRSSVEFSGPHLSQMGARKKSESASRTPLIMQESVGEATIKKKFVSIGVTMSEE